MTPATRALRAARKILPVAVAAVILTALFHRVPFREVAEVWRSAPLWPVFALGLAYWVVFLLADARILGWAIAWRHRPVRYRSIVALRGSTLALWSVNGQLAEAALALALHRRYGFALAGIGATILGLNVLELVTLGGFVAFGAALAAGTSAAGEAPIEIAAGMAVASALATGVRKASRIGAPAADAPGAPERKTAGSAAVIGGSVAVKSALLFLSAVVHRISLGAFGIDVPLSALCALLPLVYLVGALPVSVAQIGTTQAAWLYFFGAYAPESRMLAYSIVSHAVFATSHLVLGALFLPSLWRGRRSGRRASAEAAAGAG